MAVSPPEGRPGDVCPLSGISGLSFDSTLLYLSFSCAYSCYSFCLLFFLPAGPFFGIFPKKFFNIFLLRDRLFLCVWLLFSGMGKLVGQWYMQHAATWCWYLLPTCPSPVCVFWTWKIPKGITLEKFCVWCLCVYDLFHINLCQDWFCRFLENLWFDDLFAELLGL